MALLTSLVSILSRGDLPLWAVLLIALVTGGAAVLGTLSTMRSDKAKGDSSLMDSAAGFLDRMAESSLQLAEELSETRTENKDLRRSRDRLSARLAVVERDEEHARYLLTLLRQRIERYGSEQSKIAIGDLLEVERIHREEYGRRKNDENGEGSKRGSREPKLGWAERFFNVQGAGKSGSGGAPDRHMTEAQVSEERARPESGQPYGRRRDDYQSDDDRR